MAPSVVLSTTVFSSAPNCSCSTLPSAISCTRSEYATGAGAAACDMAGPPRESASAATTAPNLEDTSRGWGRRL